MESGEFNIDYEYIGEKQKVSNSQTAKVKYGENHLKLAMQIGLVMKNSYKANSLWKIYFLLKDSE